jgi:hypothetical protein
LLKVALNTIKQTNKQTDEQQIIDLFDFILWHQFHIWVSEWLLFNTYSAIFQLYHDENKLF